MALQDSNNTSGTPIRFTRMSVTNERIPGMLDESALAPPEHLARLEAEAMFIIREVCAEFERPAMLFSGGKDSIVMLHLARKAFHPARLPFPILHIDTGHNFPEVLEYRDNVARALGERLIVRSVEDAIRKGIAEESGEQASRNRAQSPTLLDAVREFRFDALFGGGRRDEERARAKERVFSFRDRAGRWDPRNQRPELWNIYNGRIKRANATSATAGEHIRAFPLSNWTELDVWEYIAHERISLPGLYYSHTRPVVKRSGYICPVSDFFPPLAGETVENLSVRFRTVGDMTCTAAIESPASSPQDIIRILRASRVSERGARIDDTFSDAAMEDRKREGYF
jgi:sulfate adenylyltransferase subunit 2